jgi:hypothetical protein
MISNEGFRGEPDFTNESYQLQLAATAVSQIASGLAESELQVASIGGDDACALMAVYAGNALEAQVWASRVTDPVKRLPALAEIAKRFQDPELVEDICSETQYSSDFDILPNLRRDEIKQTIRSLVSIAVTLEDTRPLDSIQDTTWRDRALASYIVQTEDLSVLERIDSPELRNREIAIALVANTDDDLDPYLAMLPTDESKNYALVQRAAKRYDLTAALLISNPTQRAASLLDLAERTKRSILAEELPELLLQVRRPDLILRYVDLTAESGLLSEIRSMIDTGEITNFATITAYVARTGDEEVGQKAIKELNLALGKYKPEEDIWERTVSPEFFDADFINLAIGLSDPRLAQRITSVEQRDATLLQIALKTESIDPLLLVEDIKRRSPLIAQYVVARSDLESAVGHPDLSLQQRQQAIIDIALKCGNPEIAKDYVSPIAGDRALQNLLDPKTKFLMALDRIPSLDNAYLRIASYLKHYRSGDTSVMPAILQDIENYRAGCRFESFLTIASLSTDVTAAYKALHDWIPTDDPHKIQRGIHILTLIHQLSDPTRKW